MTIVWGQAYTQEVKQTSPPSAHTHSHCSHLIEELLASCAGLDGKLQLCVHGGDAHVHLCKERHGAAVQGQTRAHRQRRGACTQGRKPCNSPALSHAEMRLAPRKPAQGERLARAIGLTGFGILVPCRKGSLRPPNYLLQNQI